MLVQIINRPTRFGKLLPGFVLDACCNIQVQVEKINDVFKAEKKEVLERIRDKRYRGFIDAANYLQGLPERKLELSETEISIVQRD